MGGGVNGDVATLTTTDARLVITGNFTEVYSSTDGYGSPAGGLATWDLNAGKWVSQNGAFVGMISLFVPIPGGSSFIAGNITAAKDHDATGWSLIQSDKNGNPSFTLTPTSLEDVSPSGSTPSPSSTTGNRRRSKARLDSDLISWLIPRLKAAVLPRQSSPTPPDLTVPFPAIAPAVLAGVFWTNSSSNHQNFVLGGNFTFVGSSGNRYSGVGIYDVHTQFMTGLQGDSINGVVYALLVQHDTLFVGGNFTVGGTPALAIYDLKSKKWNSLTQALKADSGSPYVRSISTPPTGANTVIVAGTLTGAGSTSCNAVCSWDMNHQQWSTLGSGISGHIASVDYAKV